MVVALLGVMAPTVAPTTAQANQPPVEALLIGDSVLNGLAQPYSSAGRAALAARHSFILDSAGCRRLIATSCRIPPAPAPTNAITVLRAGPVNTTARWSSRPATTIPRPASSESAQQST